jgi:hypothetical protein
VRASLSGVIDERGQPKPEIPWIAAIAVELFSSQSVPVAEPKPLVRMARIWQGKDNYQNCGF